MKSILVNNDDMGGWDMQCRIMTRTLGAAAHGPQPAGKGGGGGEEEKFIKGLMPNMILQGVSQYY